MNKQEIEIKEVGSYFQIDNDGFLVNPASLDKIQDEWKPMINEVVEVYKKQFGNNLKNVYIRGSVAKGEAIKNISDLDTFAYVDLEKEDIVKNWAKDDAINLKNKYPFVEHFEFVAKPLSSFLENKLILNQSVSVYGESLNVPKVKIGKETLRHIQFLETLMNMFEKRIRVDNENEIEHYCDWFMKNILRSGFDLVMERQNKYTRDLYLCYKSFSEFYPEKENVMKEVLYYALNPTIDKEKIIEIKNDIVPFLLNEFKNQH